MLETYEFYRVSRFGAEAGQEKLGVDGRGRRGLGGCLDGLPAGREVIMGVRAGDRAVPPASVPAVLGMPLPLGEPLPTGPLPGLQAGIGIEQPPTERTALPSLPSPKSGQRGTFASEGATSRLR